MIFSIALFEIRQRLRAPSTWIYMILFSAISFFIFVKIGDGLGGWQSNKTKSSVVWANSSYYLTTYLALIYLFGTINIAAIVGQSVYRDFNHRIDALFYSKPISEFQYLAGRFTGSCMVLVLIFSAGGLMPWLAEASGLADPSRFGPQPVFAYAQPYVFLILPNIFIAGSLFFCLAALSRKIMPVYLGGAILLMGYVLASEMVSDLSHSGLAGLLDPFGYTAMLSETELWSVSEKNTRLLSLSSTLVTNRLLWLGIASLLLFITWWRFSFTSEHKSGDKHAPAQTETGTLQTLTQASPVFNRQFKQRALFHLIWFHFVQTIRHTSFIVILICSLITLVASSFFMEDYMGTHTWPVTYGLLSLVGVTFALFLVILITLFAGELVWRERDHGIQQLHDALPLGDGVGFLAKFAALVLMIVTMLTVLMVGCITIQISQGYYRIDLPQYLVYLYVGKLPWLSFLALFALCIHTMVNHKFLGHALVILSYPLVGILDNMGFEHHLYRLFRLPHLVWSDFNGYGHYLEGFTWFSLYWAAFSVLIGVVTCLFWTRGQETAMGKRFTLFRRRLKPGHLVLASMSLIAFLSLGGWIYYNTCVLNPYITSRGLERSQALYEQRFASYENKPHPHIVNVYTQLDFYPEKRAVKGTARLTLKNTGQEPIEELFLNLPIYQRDDGADGTPEQVDVEHLELDREHQLLISDDHVKVRVYRLNSPLQPGEQMDVSCSVAYQARGFTNQPSNTRVVANGSFLMGPLFFPLPGFGSRGDLLSEYGMRKRYGLKEKSRLPSLHDQQARKTSLFGASAHWVGFEAVVSTSATQTAIAPGSLVSQWKRGSRNYFNYKSQQPIPPFYAYLSGEYQVKRDSWKGIPIEIYHHPDHEYNLDTMIAAAKHGLTYCSEAFGPYQHDHLRIVEFPRYSRYAQAFPGTIPFSESHGFIARFDPQSQTEINYPYSVTAHEVAHQWWGNQVAPALVQGAEVITESLANYSSLMVMKQKYGQQRMKTYMRYELNRYLLGRGHETESELPLYLSEGQAYLNYRKGSLALFALQAYVGEERVNRALAAFRDRFAFKGPPYATTEDLLACLEAQTPNEYKYLLDDYFRKIVFYELAVAKADYQGNPKGSHRLEVSLTARKTVANALGEEQSQPLADYVEVGAFDEDGQVIYLAKHLLTQQQTTLILELSEKPSRVAVDPYNLLIDREPDDNEVSVEEASW